jgi:hypothetical protein
MACFCSSPDLNCKISRQDAKAPSTARTIIESPGTPSELCRISFDLLPLLFLVSLGVLGALAAVF